MKGARRVHPNATMAHAPQGSAGFVEFEVPLPPRELSPNGRADWHEQMRAKATYRGEVALLCRSACNRIVWKPPARARVALVFGTAPARVPDGFYRPRDVPNAIAAFKAGYDGLIDGGAIQDDDGRRMTLGHTEIDPKRGPGVYVVVEAVSR